MCGICGYVGSGEEGLLTVRRMVSRLRHRGPDDIGVLADGPLVLGHTRLAILDLSQAGRQPMTRFGLTACFNGEIYNYLELGRTLERDHGFVFTTRTDTEVLLAAWKVWGPTSLSRFRGMWALAIHDPATNSLTLSRDRFGIKPLYYHVGRDRFLFASEIKALLEDSSLSRRADLSTVADFLLCGLQDHRAETFFADVLQLMPGMMLKLNLADRSFAVTRYYDLAEAVRGHTTSPEAFGETLAEAVRLHLRSDVPVGVCLSGGLDSSSLAALATSGHPGLMAVTASSGVARNDETAFAGMVVKHCNLGWRRATPGVDDFLKEFESCLWHQDEPPLSFSVFMQHEVMREARAAGCTVMLDGQGGDECLLGYERYYPTLLLHWVSRLRLCRAVREGYLASRHSRLTLPTLAQYIAYFLMPGVRTRRLRRRLPGFPPELARGSLVRLDELQRSFYSLERLQVAEVTAFQLPHLLKYEDRNSMAHSIEARVPFVDHKVVEAGLTLAPEDKIHDGYTKWCLRRYIDNKLPAPVVWRTNKIGFEAPSREWIATLGHPMRQAVRGSALASVFGLSSLAETHPVFQPLYILARWEALFGVTL